MPASAAPYESNADYLDTETERVRTLALLKKHRARKNPLNNLFDLAAERAKGSSPEQTAAQEKEILKQRLQEQQARCRRRLRATREAGSWRPALEKIAEEHALCDFARDVLLVLAVAEIAEDVRNVLSRLPAVEDVMALLAPTPSEHVRKRRQFYRDAPLLADGLVEMKLDFGRLAHARVRIDPRILNRILGLEGEGSHLMDGSHLYAPTTPLAQVVLPPERKKRIVETVEHFEAFRRARRRLGLDERLQYGRGLVMLFYGPSGTGKTMMANALANHVGRRLLLVNFSLWSLFENSDELLRVLFREAEAHDAVLFFDECEVVFGERNATLLTEIERHDGLVLMATNAPDALDEAMHRRITRAVPFEKPSADLREQIWSGLLPKRIAKDVDPGVLARRYSLTGGLIKNAVLAALSRAAARDEEAPRLTQGDLEDAARRQLRGLLSQSSFQNKVTPEVGLDALVVPEAPREQLDELVGLERARPALFERWGLTARETGGGRGTIALFHGPPGTGKTLAAEAVGHELGRPLRRVTPAEVHSKYVGETARVLESIFDEADALLARRTGVSGATDRYANADVNTLLGLLERFAGLAIMTTNLEETLDPALERRVRYRLAFPRPDAALRRRLWRTLLPEKLPLGDAVDVEMLAESVELTGAAIQNAVRRAASQAARRSGSEQCVTMEDLQRAARREAEQTITNSRVGFAT